MKIIKKWRKQRDCFHHDPKTKQSWIRSMLVDLGRAKLFWCEECGRTWL